jgi:hypothetical protein
MVVVMYAVMDRGNVAVAVAVVCLVGHWWEPLFVEPVADGDTSPCVSLLSQHEDVESQGASNNM